MGGSRAGLRLLRLLVRAPDSLGSGARAPLLSVSNGEVGALPGVVPVLLAASRGAPLVAAEDDDDEDDEAEVDGADADWLAGMDSVDVPKLRLSC